LLKKNIIRRTKSAAIDLRYGALLNSSWIAPAVEGSDIYGAQNSGYHVLNSLLKPQVRDNDILADIGCGKGRVLNWWLRNFGTRKAYGIEIDRAIAETTRARLRRYTSIKILTGNAVDLLPQDATLLYLNNPFGKKIMSEFISKITSASIPRRIVYFNYVCAIDLFMSDPRFSVTMIDGVENRGSRPYTDV
jgi:hypothetical protein